MKEQRKEQHYESPAKVYLDGQLIGNAGNFDGYPNYLWLEVGTHQLIFYRDGRETAAAEFTTKPGVVGQVRVRMKRGETVDPESLIAGTNHSNHG